MLGLLVIIVISWLLLRFFEKENIDVLGIIPSLNRIGYFIIGFLIITIIVGITISVETVIKDMQWELRKVNYSILGNAFIYHVKSALTEDLVFRGAILCILIKRIGPAKAILLSAIVFGVYHWFSYGILEERFIVLAYVFIVTGFTGYVWAYAFYKTKSIMIGLGFHLGYNLIMACFFDAQPYGEMLMHVTSKTNLTGWPDFYALMFRGLFPSLATLGCLKVVLNSRLFHQEERKRLSK